MKKTGDVEAREAIQRQKILNRVITFYHQAFLSNPVGIKYLEGLGLREAPLFSTFQVGLVNGTLLSTIPEDGELQENLKALGVLNGDGQEVLAGCVVFPWFDENGDCGGAWGLSMTTPMETRGIYLGPGRGASGTLWQWTRGVWNYTAAKRSRVIILTDTILSGLFLIQAGFREVVAVNGIFDGHGKELSADRSLNGDHSLSGDRSLSGDHLRLFQQSATREVILTFESEKIEEQLRGEEIFCRRVTLPSVMADPKEIQKAFQSVNFQASREEDMPLVSQEMNVVPAARCADGQGVEETEGGFAVQYGNRRWEVKGVEKKGVRLMATLKVCRKAGELPLYLDSVDLYSSRSRILFGKCCAVALGEKDETIYRDLVGLIETAEKHQPKGVESKKAPPMTKEEEAEAFGLLKDPNLLTRILEDFDRCGLTGEEDNKLIGYLASISRKLEEPLSVLIQSRSAAGKSTLQDALLRFVPEEDYEKYTRLTGQALFYKAEGGLSHKLLAIEEEAGAREAGYSIRNLQSSKCLSIATTEKDSLTGKLKTVEYKVKGPVALMLTTTSVDMDYETQNRFVTLTIDESKEMTERILAHQRQLQTAEGLRLKREGEKAARRQKNAQRLLKSIWVVNPYAPKLTFPANSLRARRDHKKYLGLIQAIAFLHQYQREVKVMTFEGERVEYVEATSEDVEEANRLMAGVLGQTMGELSAPGKVLLVKVREMVKERAKDQRDFRFTRRDIREFSGWSDFQVKTHIRELADLEYLYSVSGKKGKEYVYELTALEGGGVVDLVGWRVLGGDLEAELKTAKPLYSGRV